MKSNANRRNRHGHGDIRRIHLTVREHRDRAQMIGFAMFRVKKFVKLWRRGQCVQQQNEHHQQTAERQFGQACESFAGDLQCVCKLAHTCLGASVGQSRIQSA